MRNGIVEGEPGIFPEPVARFLRAVGNLFNRGEKADDTPRDEGDRPNPDGEGRPPA
jgi:hypothetical protein